MLFALVTGFNQRSFTYALARGWAYGALVESRATTDIDLLISLSSSLLVELHSMLLLLFDSTGCTCADGLSGDIGLAMCGNSQRSEKSSSICPWRTLNIFEPCWRGGDVPFDAVPTLILTLEDLCLVLKTLAGRLQDQANLENVRVCQDDLRVDWDCTREWKAGFSRRERSSLLLRIPPKSLCLCERRLRGCPGLL